jgi:DNA polymerase-4
MTRWILHADMDAFYASIEQRDDPALRGRPVIVGAVSGRGVVAAASYEARRFGVRSAMPGFRAHELCPDGVYLPSNMRLYAAVSAQIQDIFRDFTPLVEPLALDEAFLDISGSAHLFGGALAAAEQLKRRVREATQLSVSVGLAPNKLVAKIACSLGKPDGLRVVDSASLQSVLDPLPVGYLWGVGPVLREQLASAGISSVAQLRTFESAALQALVGPRAAELQALARGDDERPVEADRAPKSYGEENTFEQDVQEQRVIEDALHAHADAVAQRLRNDGYRGRTVTLKIKLARADQSRGSPRGPRYPLLSRSRTLPEATDDGPLIGRIACELFRAAALAEPVRLLGVSLSGLSAARPAVPAQLSLFEAPKPRDPLGPALDAITRRFGAGAIRRAVAAPGKITHGRGIKRGEDGRHD